MCEEDSVQYLRDLIKEKDNLDKKEEHHLLKKLLIKGKLLINILKPSAITRSNMQPNHRTSD